MGIHWSIIRNPQACSGKGAKLWPRIEEMLNKAGISYSEMETSRPLHAFEMARDLVRTGSTHLIAVGGDGTVNEVVNGIFGQSENNPANVVLTQIPIGTGNDWRRTVGIPTKLEACIQMLQDFKEIKQDIGLVQWEEQEREVKRYFANVAGMGFEALAGQKANAQKAAGKGGIMGYVSALIATLRQFNSLDAEIIIDGKALPKSPVFSLSVGICKYNGGGMMPCPQAELDDGLLDLTLIREISKAAVIANIPRLFSGKFVRHSAVTQFKCKSIEVKTGIDNLLETDGEVIGQGNAHFTLLPQALRVAIPRQA